MRPFLIGANTGHYEELPDIGEQSMLLDRWPVIRFMDWQKTNNSSAQSMDDLPIHNSDWDYRGGPWDEWAGVPLSVCLAVSNSLKARAWVCVPHLFGEMEMREFVDYVVERAKFRPIFEYSNECWNSQFQQYHALLAAMRDNGNEDDEFRAVLIGYAEMVKALSFAVGNRGDVVLGGWAANGWSTDFMHNQTGVGDFVNAIAIAPYFRDSAELELIPERIEAHKKIADKAGCELWCYEFGQHDTTQLAAQHNRTELMATAYHRLVEMLRDGGVSLACAYSIASEYRAGHAWGLWEIVNGIAKQSPKLRVLQSETE